MTFDSRPTAEYGVVFSAAHRRGGVERVAWDFLSHLGATGKKATFYGNELTPPVGTGVDFVEVPKGRVPDALQPLAFRTYAAKAIGRRRPPTLLSFGANCPPGDVFWVHSVHRAWLARSKTVTWHGRAISPAARYILPRHRVLLSMEREYFTRSNPKLVLCTSQQEVEDLVDFYDVPRETMHVVPNGFDVAQFSPTRRRTMRREVREAMGAAEDDFVLLMVANELNRKGFGETVRAVGQLGDERVRISLVGKKAPTDYAELIGRLGLQDRVRWHGPTDDVGWWHAGADILVLPTQYEPFGIVIVEAMASGVPVLTTRLAGASSAITHGESGLLQDDPYDVEELTELLRLAIAADLPLWGQNAVAAAAPYQWDTIFRRVDGLLDRLEDAAPRNP